MQRATQDLPTQLVPIVSRIRKVKMPCLVHRVGWRNFVIGNGRQENEPLVLGYDSIRVRQRPAVLGSQS